MSDILTDKDAPRKVYRPNRFVARCPLCDFVATTVRGGIEQECLAAHLVYVHVPETDPDAVRG